MAKKHDESTDVRILRRLGCNFSTMASATEKCAVKCISVPKTLGIRALGRVDYLVNILGYRKVSGISNTTRNSETSDSKSFRDIKKQKKEHKLTDKTKKRK
uniref:Uncharacterized protein n=1 Tax=Geladintestivirus 1 TaxID=3233133 RepID=A0AAU8MJS6_9CAUD